MTHLQRCLLLLMLLTGCAAWATEPVSVIRHRPADSPNDRRFEYFVELLQLALDKTVAEYGAYRLEPASLPISQDRAFELVRRGHYLDIVWGMTSKQREQQALPVRIPLLKGLLAHRVLLIRPSQAQTFSQITRLEQLARHTGVQGDGWPDTAILQANGLDILTSGDYEGMLRMVSLGRVDYFPRSVAEVWAEMERFASNTLALSPSPLLVYDGPIYFFVNPRNTTLAERLQRGLRRALEDGSFDQLFHAHKDLRRALAFLKQGGYRVLRLHNPTLPEATPLHDPALWLRLPPTANPLTP